MAEKESTGPTIASAPEQLRKKSKLYGKMLLKCRLGKSEGKMEEHGYTQRMTNLYTLHCCVLASRLKVQKPLLAREVGKIEE